MLARFQECSKCRVFPNHYGEWQEEASIQRVPVLDRYLAEGQSQPESTSLVEKVLDPTYDADRYTQENLFGRLPEDLGDRICSHFAEHPADPDQEYILQSFYEVDLESMRAKRHFVVTTEPLRQAMLQEGTKVWVHLGETHFLSRNWDGSYKPNYGPTGPLGPWGRCGFHRAPPQFRDKLYALLNI